MVVRHNRRLSILFVNHGLLYPQVNASNVRRTAKEQLVKIVDVQLRSLERRLASRGLSLRLSDAARKLLSDEGYDPQFGARPLRRVIQQRIENPLASRLLHGDFQEGETICIDADESRQHFTFARSAPATVRI